MQIAILADNNNSFIVPLAQGLQRMLVKLKVESKIFYNGHDILQFNHIFENNIQELKKYQLIVVVSNIPTAFLKGVFDNIERIRKEAPDIPIAYYANYFLPTRIPWPRWLKDGAPDKGVGQGNNWGLERFDWHLVASVVSESPLPEKIPYSHIGINLESDTLYPQKKEDFVALIDFERSGFQNERAVQIQALKETNTKYIVLDGNYTHDQIREIYRKCSIYFLAFRESFGFPICELQACGSYIFTPYDYWAPSHWLKDPKLQGSGDLSPNFVVYDNHLQKLKEKIIEIKSCYDSDKVFQTFLKYHSQLYYGDQNELRRFIKLFRTGVITSKFHQNFPNLEELVQITNC